MNCSKLHLDVPFVNIPSETLPPIPPPFLFKSPYEINKPTWCQIPNIQLQFEEIGSTKSREIGNESYLLIGRNERCHIILDDLMVSRCHALLLNTSTGDSYLVDVGSSHGTYLGNVRLAPFVPTLIKKCSLIRFGSAEKQYIIREYPKVDDVLKKSNICESVEEKEVVLNTFHNITCLSSCTSTITKSLSISKLFGRTPTDSSIKNNQREYQYINNNNNNNNNNNINNLNLKNLQDSNRSNSIDNMGTNSSTDDLMSICTSRESSLDSSISDLHQQFQQHQHHQQQNQQQQHQQQHSYHICTTNNNNNIDNKNINIQNNNNNNSNNGQYSNIMSSLITPDSSIHQNFFFSLSNSLSNLPPPSLSNEPTLEIDATSVSSPSSSPSSSTTSPSGGSNIEYSENNIYPTIHELPLPSLECSQEQPSPEIRKCLRRSFSVDSTTRLTPHSCFYVTPSRACGSNNNGGVSSLNFGRRTSSVDLTRNGMSPRLIGSKCHANGEVCGRKRVRFSISEFDLSKHQDREIIRETHQYESYVKNY